MYFFCFDIHSTAVNVLIPDFTFQTIQSRYISINKILFKQHQYLQQQNNLNILDRHRGMQTPTLPLGTLVLVIYVWCNVQCAFDTLCVVLRKYVFAIMWSILIYKKGEKYLFVGIDFFFFVIIFDYFSDFRSMPIVVSSTRNKNNFPFVLFKIVYAKNVICCRSQYQQSIKDNK